MCESEGGGKATGIKIRKHEERQCQDMGGCKLGGEGSEEKEKKEEALCLRSRQERQK